MNMNGLLPIIRRVRRPLIPADEPVVKVVAPAPMPEGAEKASDETPAPPVIASKEVHAPGSLQTAAAS